MNQLKINDLLTEKISGEWGKESTNNIGVNVLRTTNFMDKGEINFDNIVIRDIPHDKVIKKKLIDGDIIIEKSGGSPTQPVGRVVIFFQPNDQTYLCNNFTTILRPDRTKVFPKYLFFVLWYNHKIGKTLRYQNKTTGIINLKLDNYLNSKIPIPENYEDQIRIATLLSRAESLIAKRKEGIRLLDELVKSTFWKMFHILNSKNEFKKESTLGDIADVMSGITKGKKYKNKKIVTVPYLRVANVQDGFIDIGELKEIQATEGEIFKYQLQENDLLLTEGGDPDKLGRGAIWKFHIPNCIYQNHLFRVRLKSHEIIPIYLSALIGSVYGKKYFLKAAKQTTGIATINSKQLKKFPLIKPPIDLQNKFAQIVEKVESIKTKYEASLTELENLYGSLSQRAFRGELDLSRVPIDTAIKPEFHGIPNE